MNKQFIKYLLNSNKALNVFLLILNIIFSLFYFINLNNYNETFSISLISYAIALSFILVILESITLPIIELGFLHSRKRLDIYLSLPIKRQKIVITTIFEIIIKIALLHFVTVAPIFIANYANLNLAGIIIYIVLTLLIITSIVLFVSGICLKTNSSMDAVIVTIAYIFIPIILYMAFLIFGYNYIIGINNAYIEFLDNTISPFFIINLIDSISSAAIGRSFNLNYMHIIILLFIALYGLFMIITSLKNFKAERAESISNDILTYPTIIFLGTMAIMFVVMFEDMPILNKIMYLLFVYAGYSIMTFIHQRRIIFTKKSIITFVMIIILSFGFITFAKQTDGFGLNYSFMNKQNMKEVNLYYDISLDDGNDYYTFNAHLGEFTYSDSFKDYVKKDQCAMVDILSKDSYEYNDGKIHMFKNLEVIYDDNSIYSYYCHNNGCLVNDSDYILNELKEYEKNGAKFEYSSNNYSDSNEEVVSYNNLEEFSKALNEIIDK